MPAAQVPFFDTIDYEANNGVATIRLNRESRYNAINSQVSRGLPLLNACGHIITHNDTPDYTEGVRAFREKRTPQWRLYQGD